MEKLKKRIGRKWAYLLLGLCMALLFSTAKAGATEITGKVDYGYAARLLAQANAKLAAQGKPTVKMDAYLQQLALHDASIAVMPGADEGSFTTYSAKPLEQKPELKWQQMSGAGRAYKTESDRVDDIVESVEGYLKWYSDRMQGSGELLAGVGYITGVPRASYMDAQWDEWYPELDATTAVCIMIGYGVCTPAPTAGVETRTFRETSTIDYSSIKKFTGGTDASVKKVSSIKITGSSSLAAGKSTTLKATVSPSNAANKSVTWSSSNTKYATVSSKGVVKAKTAGVGKTVTITAKAKDGSGKKATFKIKIKKASTVKVTSVKITGKTSVLAGKKITLKATASPSKATNKAVTWSSSNKKYATVSSKGVVTAKAAGAGKTVTITAKAKDGSGKKATYKVKIKGAVSKITLKASKSLKVGKSTTVKATVKVGKGGSKALKWTTSNKKYATVSAKGVVKALKAGKGKTVTITAKAKDGSGKKATVKITLK